MGSSILTSAAVIPAPTADDISVQTVGTTATSEVDLYYALGIASASGARPPAGTGRAKVTVTASGGDVGVVFGESGLAAPSLSSTDSSSPSGKCALVPDGTSRTFDIRVSTRYMRAVASAADTRMEVTLG